jgi:hypothetical protein
VGAKEAVDALHAPHDDRKGAAADAPQEAVATSEQQRLSFHEREHFPLSQFAIHSKAKANTERKLL